MKQRFVLLVMGLLLSACKGADPFGLEPKGVSPNCGPEYRYKYDKTIKSAQDFVDFIKQHELELVDQYGHRWVRLDNFKHVSRDMSGAKVETPVNWEKVLNAVVTETVNGRTVYRLTFEPLTCPAQGFTLKMTNDGHVSLYGCCGK